MTVARVGFLATRSAAMLIRSIGLAERSQPRIEGVTMRLLFSTFALIFLCFQTGLGQKLEIKETNGGSITTQLGMGIAVNSESSLNRKWLVLNDTPCPARLDAAGIRTVYVD